MKNEQFVQMPFLPKRPVKSVVVGTSARGLEKDFLQLGIRLVFAEPQNTFKHALRGHIDLAIAPGGKRRFFLSEQQKALARFLSAENCTCSFISETPIDPYPFDVPLNCVFIGEYLFCNTKTASIQIQQFARFNGFQIIHVQQGYTKCSVCPITEQALITDDSGIFTAARKKGFDALLVQKGSVELPGYEYGFIGGCCGKIAPNRLLFIGAARQHCDYNRIYSFTQKYGIDIVSLNQNKLFDIGSFIPLTESEETE